MAVANIKITQDGPTGKLTRIYLEGKDISRFVRSFEIKHDATTGGTNIINLQLIARIDMPEDIKMLIGVHLIETVEANKE